eukprot:4563731-Pyramimonas_sp.AAC.2
MVPFTVMLSKSYGMFYRKVSPPTSGEPSWLVRRENIPARPASGWSGVRVYPHVLRLIGPS